MLITQRWSGAGAFGPGTSGISCASFLGGNKIKVTIPGTYSCLRFDK